MNRLPCDGAGDQISADKIVVRVGRSSSSGLLQAVPWPGTRAHRILADAASTAPLTRGAKFTAILCLAALSACTTMDRRAAAALGTAGENATQALSAQTSAADGTIARLDQSWGVRDALACARTSAALHAACLKGVSGTPSPELSRQIASISDALAKRRRALDSLHEAYGAFVDLSKYNAGAEATAALKTSFDNVNAFTSATAALGPGGAAAAPISTTIEKVTGAGVAVYANRREDKLILAANADLGAASRALSAGLNQEKDAVDSLLQTLSAEQNALLRAGYEAGLISASQILTPVFQEARSGVQLTPPPPADADVVDAAASIVLASQAGSQEAAASKTYDDGLSALNALVAQHTKLSKGEALNLAAVEDAVADLNSDLSVISKAPDK